MRGVDGTPLTEGAQRGEMKGAGESTKPAPPPAPAKPTNPPAFPCPIGHAPAKAAGGGYFNDQQAGMTMRDYFASDAMNGFLSSSRLDLSVSMDLVAQESYRAADAMLKARAE